ncbi:hypothetical protein ACFYM3_43410 [Streptomyces massasporeus]|uniref:Transposase n=1 Tax=Streptomyces massasporeus TaxID=67324 RepID=A0ABW6LU47_9ACTN
MTCRIRSVKRRGHAKALIAVARSILVIAWHLINDLDASYNELGADWHRCHLGPARKARDLVRRLQPLGHQVPHTGISLTGPSRLHPVRKRTGWCRLPSRTSVFRSAGGRGWS